MQNHKGKKTRYNLSPDRMKVKVLGRNNGLQVEVDGR